MKKSLLFTLMLLMVASLTWAAGTKEASTEGPVVLTAYMQIDPANDQYAGHNAVMAAFAEKYPNIKLDIEYASGEAFHQKFQSMAASKKIPDLFTCYGGARTAYVTETGLTLDLTPYLDDSFKSQFASATWLPQGSAGALYMIPPSFAVCHTVYANTAILKKLGLEYPKTFEELLAQVPVIRKAGYYPMSMGNKDPWVVNSWLLGTFIERFGGREWLLKAAKGEASFTEAPFVKSLEIIKSMSDNGLFSPGVNQMSNTEADQEFYQQKSVYLIDAAWRTSAMDSQLPAEQRDAIEMRVFPALPGEIVHNTSSAVASEGFGIAKAVEKDKAKLEAALTFIKFYNGAEGAAIRAQYGEVPSYNLDLSKTKLDIMQGKFVTFSATYPMGYVFDSIMDGEGVTLLNTDLQAMMMGNGNPSDIASKYEAWVAQNDSNRD
ncbi:MAG: ABC transporter substrate-binding protein [Sphaerochaeta sp.]|uniref:ABC transporter substrate-binding protein n=1 Tax=Sphaerochaeta sp. TaxID=1972642 RepID=UPI002FC756C0